MKSLNYEKIKYFQHKMEQLNKREAQLEKILSREQAINEQYENVLRDFNIWQSMIATRPSHALSLARIRSSLQEKGGRLAALAGQLDEIRDMHRELVQVREQIAQSQYQLSQLTYPKSPLTGSKPESKAGVTANKSVSSVKPGHRP